MRHTGTWVSAGDTKYLGQCRGIMLLSKLEKAERVDTVIVKEPNRGETLKKKVETWPFTTCGSQGL